MDIMNQSSLNFIGDDEPKEDPKDTQNCRKVAKVWCITEEISNDSC